MGHIQLVITIAVILCLVFSGMYFVYVKFHEARIETLKTNMLLIEWKAKEYENARVLAGEEKQHIGTKVSDMQDNALIKPLLENNIILPDDYDKYYVLTDDDLNTLQVNVSNEKNSYYIINYENSDILITKGCGYKYGENLYRLEDIENAKQIENFTENLLNNENVNEENIESIVEETENVENSNTEE